jgi:nitrite reductase/ring-hydroxylating ferredoxin subunit
MTDAPVPHLDRRRLLGCTALLGLTGPLLVACGSDDSDAAPPAQERDGASASPEASEPSGGGSGGQAGLVAVAKVPVGGGVVLTDQKIIVTQPTKGEFKAYTSVCTHQGGALTSVNDGVMTCSLHGSQFAIEDGANVVGPNGSDGGSVDPLPEVAVRVEGDQVVKA